MFEKVLVTGQNDETLLPRVLRVLSKQGAQVRSLRMDAEENRLKLEIQLAESCFIGNLSPCQASALEAQLILLGYILTKSPKGYWVKKA